MAKYTYPKVPRHPAALAQKYSLVLPMHPEITEEQLQASWRTVRVLKRYRSLWRQRVEQLRELNCYQTQDGRSRFMSDCPPVFSRCKVGTHRKCRRYLICPFCWARNVTLKCYKKCELALFGINTIPRKPEAKLKAATETIANFKLAINERVFLDNGTVPIDDLISMAKLSGRRQPRGAHGTFRLNTIEPTLVKDDLYWRTSKRVLAIVPQAYETSRVFRDGIITRGILAEAVGRTCAYPIGMLTGPVEEALSILDARGGSRGRAPRLSVCYGALRGKAREQPIVNDGDL